MLRCKFIYLHRFRFQPHNFSYRFFFIGNGKKIRILPIDQQEKKAETEARELKELQRERESQILVNEIDYLFEMRKINCGHAASCS